MRISSGIVVLTALALLPMLAEAQVVGLRAGVSADPDQFYFGVHGHAGEILDGIEFRPNLEVGVGDDRTTVALNGEFVYPFELRNGAALYAGGGPALVLIRRDRPNQPGGTTNVEPGFNFLAGMLFGSRYFAEIKLGVIDSPEFKLGFGVTF